MGFGGINIWSLLLILVIVLLLFGTKKLRNLGGDLGAAIKSFKSAVKDNDAEAKRSAEEVEHQVEGSDAQTRPEEPARAGADDAASGAAAESAQRPEPSAREHAVEGNDRR